jgi:hypothetical protein
VFPSATKCFVEGDQLNACYTPGDDVLGFEGKLLSLGIQDVEEVRQPSVIALGRKLDCVCSPSAPLRQTEGLHEGRISGSS